MKKLVLISLILFILCSCTNRSGIKGIDYPFSIESGSLRITDVQKKESFTEFNQTMYPREGNVFLFVTIQVEGIIPSAGVEEKTTNLLNGNWSLIDINHKTYEGSALVGGDLVFEIPFLATGLQLALGSTMKIPLGSFFGEEIIVEDQNSNIQNMTPLPEVSNDDWTIQVMEAYWQTDVGTLISPGTNERVLALTINLEYVGKEADIIEKDFIRVTDDRDRGLELQSDLILNNGEVPDGGKDWIAISKVKEATRHFVTGEKFNLLVLFFIGMEDAQGFVLHVDGLPPIELSKIVITQ